MNGSKSQAGCFWMLLPRITLAPQPYPTRNTTFGIYPHIEHPGTLGANVRKHSETTTANPPQRNHHSESITEAGIMASAKIVEQGPGLWPTSRWYRSQDCGQR